MADPATKKILQLSYYELKNGLAPETLRDILEAEKIDLLTTRRIVLSNACKEMLLVPVHLFTQESARRFFSNQFGNTADTLFFDDVAEQSLVIVHAVPQAIIALLKSSYGTEITHWFSCKLKDHNGFGNPDCISVHFTGKEIYVIARKEEQLKLVQTYFYTTPLDVVYYLLAICQQYGMPQSETILLLSGLVSDDSAMYNELYQYFSNVQFWKPATMALLQSEYPHHYFSSMYNLGACVL